MTTHDRPLQRASLARRAFANIVLAAVAALLLLAGAGSARAQSPDADPPGRVARLSEASGQVWLYGPDSNEWLSVGRNRPLTTGDRIATDTNARAEISLGSTTLRLDAGTELEVVRLDDARFVVRMMNGSVVARLRNPASAAELELDTDEGRFRAQSAGRLRVDRFDQASELTVYAGQAVFEGRNSALPLTAGQHGQFWLDAAGAAQYTLLAPVRDAFAAWSDERDRAEDSVAVARYVSPEMTGADDLDRYGRWEQSPEYGALWTPAAVPDNWAPYSTGHWAFVRPWGWTWVDDAPWGFAPFHYGRWVNYRDRWCWAPGTYVARPVYAPALVAWVGGPRVSVSINIGGRSGPPVGWFPLAPREVYVPSYRSSPGYVRNVNITHVTNITNITTIINNRNGEADRRDFANRRFPNAVTVVPASVLTGRQSVGPSALQYRNNPQVRAFVADARPGAAFSAPPVAAPPAPQRGFDARPTPKPPFEGRGAGAGSLAGRDAGVRPDASRDAGRRDGGRPDVDRRDGDRRDGDRRDGDRRGGDRPGATPAPVAGAAPQGGPPPVAVGSPQRPGGAPAAISPQRPLGGEGAAPIAPQRPLGGEAAAPIAPVAPMGGPAAAGRHRARAGG